MRRITLVGLIIFPFLISQLQAKTVGELHLVAHVRSTSQTHVKQFNLSSNQLKWIVLNQINAEHSSETQKFEIEGLDQEGMDSHIKKIESKDRTIQYEILVNRIKNTLMENKPIFLKITAN